MQRALRLFLIAHLLMNLSACALWGEKREFGPTLADLPAGATGACDGGSPLPVAGAALLGGAAPVPPMAPARLRPGPPPGRRGVPVRARHGRCAHAGH